jgi:hypothetical protein
MTNKVVVPDRQAKNRFLGSLKALKIRAQRVLTLPVPLRHSGVFSQLNTDEGWETLQYCMPRFNIFKAKTTDDVPQTLHLYIHKETSSVI